jgi:hypothetical protein
MFQEEYGRQPDLGCFESLDEMLACECGDLCTLKMDKVSQDRKLIPKE